MEPQRVGICGSGIMGSGILEVMATAGHHSVLYSRSSQSAEDSRDLVTTRLQRSVAKERLSKSEADTIMARISVTENLHTFHDMDFVIESVVEDLNVKRDLFEQLDDICQPSTILLTNTSTLSVVEMGIASGRSSQVCGLHFFNPAPVMEAVEVVRTLTSAESTIDSVVELAKSCSKKPVVVMDEAGFVVNNLLFPYLNRAITLLERGSYDPSDVDDLMKGGCGFPMGPLELLDLIGLDTSLAILDALYAEFHDESCNADPKLRRLVSAGHLGRKSGQGFYKHT